ncbi:hypothetical protein [Floricoccus penangensis]|uniref:hypothetical protein n=1 Tax=Floricoccus penangensis TaxID=1859475 RepID=UPI00203E3638|nr:hypothetical protein [Floricoccus penangensis]URZ87875.1 hypothetical protein KIW23_02165 [Floricoccus penangensis]
MNEDKNELNKKNTFKTDFLEEYHCILIIVVASFLMSIATILFKNHIDMTVPFFIASIGLIPIILKIEKLEDYSNTWIKEFNFKQRFLLYIFLILLFYIIYKTQFPNVDVPAPFNMNADMTGILFQILVYLFMIFMILCMYAVYSVIIWGIGIAFIAFFAPKFAKKIIKKEKRDSE